ncbi:hypothetical protein HY095_04055 [Candidatus Micrarchaeota archaeon]|nr:hypothetical protein [Candidatus Micrarchaeota archaeon]
MTNNMVPGNGFTKKFDDAEGYPELFTIVKEGVEKVLGGRRAGLMLGIAELGAAPGGIVGAYHPVDTNVIVLNNTALSLIRRQSPKLVKPFVFHLLMHEYIHSLGMHDELETRRTTHYVSKEIFGRDHLLTQIASNPAQFFPRLSFEIPANQIGEVTLVRGFERESERGYS